MRWPASWSTLPLVSSQFAGSVKLVLECRGPSPLNLLLHWLVAECGNSPKASDTRPVVGFCFSFPVEQTAINSGKIIIWTKGVQREFSLVFFAQMLSDS